MSLSRRLGHGKLKDLVNTTESVLHSRMKDTVSISGSSILLKQPSISVQEPMQSAQSYIKSYFEQVHPIYPFLDRKAFEDKAFGPQLRPLLGSNSSWSALYHTVLALGCQYHDGGTFDAGRGKAWKFFHLALGLFPDLLIPKGALVNAQAIFALNFSCLQIDELLVTEAARIALSLGLNKTNRSGDTESECRRTFWVIYSLEKEFCFNDAKPSTILDYDIGCPVPETHVAVFGELDWLLTYVRFSRLLSKAYESLFSVSATLNSQQTYFEAIDGLRDDLERWRSSIPDDFQPGKPFRPHSLLQPSSTLVALRIHYSYYNVLIVLSRLTVHISGQDESQRQSESMKTLLNAARSILDLTKHADLESYTPIWILGTMPLAALFILFDFVVHNPTHPETRACLAYLDIAAGYFSRLEFASGGSCPSSLLSEFTYIARQYYGDATTSHGFVPSSRGAQQIFLSMNSMLSTGDWSKTGITSVSSERTKISGQPPKDFGPVLILHTRPN
ncbi:hypothetical protein K469DRAFT_730588 [Zopfia rhizophila CBS 207.26]|uniref:Xylanolytic transcriptional activator regulatory domain-containing protein n=1 Tax=Zopfia rhizophila CBS 207.26 TaxID=1314779 RepID=A0A6A6DMY8_9PEZI|nr:hypothetical protein K469DRAFT_730588 [Zopfia rhizophila CBS 207.26]